MSIMDLSLSDIKMEIGSGHADFPMTRGSFKYKEKLSYKKQISAEDAGGALTEVEGRLELTFNSEKIRTLARKNSGGNGIGGSDINRLWITIPVGKGAHYYGCGETFSEFDLKGQKVRIWVAEHQNTDRISKKIIKQKLLGKSPDKKMPFDRYESYYVQPTVVSSEGFFIHVDGSGYMEFDFRKDGSLTVHMRENSKIIIGASENFTELSENLSGLLGRQQKLPDWLYDGVILAVQGGTDTVQHKIDTAKAHGISVNGIWSQDWCGCRKTGFGYQVMWNWKWDEELYPELDKKIAEWKAEGIRFLGYINPFMAIEKDLYRYAAAHGYCVKDKKGKDYLVTITTFPAAMIDFTNPEAYEWYKSILKENLIGIGLGGWMADFGEYLPPDCVLYSGEDPWVKHNEWPAIWAKMNREALEECGVSDEVFFFTRAGFTDTVRYSTMMWNGDQHVDYSVDDGIGSVIPATLSLAMSGFGITHSDIGGYTTIMNMTRGKELLMRWAEMNAFTPLMRSHEGNQPARNVQFDLDDELLNHIARVTDWHVALKEYINAAVAECAARGTPVIRPLFYHYDEEAAYEESEEYLLGRDILVAPVIKEGMTERSVYLPEDIWVHVFSGKVYKGGTVTVKSPVGEPPVFIRKESDAIKLVDELT
jgi:alpha-glucosidase